MTSKKRKIGEISGGDEAIVPHRGRRRGTVTDILRYLEQFVNLKLKTPMQKIPISRKHSQGTNIASERAAYSISSPSINIT
jgi:hypothetical protein